MTASPWHRRSASSRLWVVRKIVVPSWWARRKEAEQQPDRGRLSRPVGTEEPEDRSGWHFEGEIFDRNQVPELTAQSLGPDGGRSGHSRGSDLTLGTAGTRRSCGRWP